MCGPQIQLCLFTFRPIASKQLNSLTTIITLSWLGGAVVWHLLWVQEVPGSIPGSGKGFYVWFFVLLLLRFYFLSKSTLFVTKCCNSFCNVNLFSILNILQDLWPIIRVLRYRPIIFKTKAPIKLDVQGLMHYWVIDPPLLEKYTFKVLGS